MKHILPTLVVIGLCSLPANGDDVTTRHTSTFLSSADSLPRLDSAVTRSVRIAALPELPDRHAAPEPHRYPAGSDLPPPIRHVDESAITREHSPTSHQHRHAKPDRSEKNKKSPKLFSKLIEMDRKKNAWLKKTFGLQ
jgi:hypothetical protein